MFEPQLLLSVPFQFSHISSHEEFNEPQPPSPPVNLEPKTSKAGHVNNLSVIFIAASSSCCWHELCGLVSLSPHCSSTDCRLVQEAAADSEPGREGGSGRLLLILPGLLLNDDKYSQFHTIIVNRLLFFLFAVVVTLKKIKAVCSFNHLRYWFMTWSRCSIHAV